MHNYRFSLNSKIQRLIKSVFVFAMLVSPASADDAFDLKAAKAWAALESDGAIWSRFDYSMRCDRSVGVASGKGQDRELWFPQHIAGPKVAKAVYDKRVEERLPGKVVWLCGTYRAGWAVVRDDAALADLKQYYRVE